MNLDVRVEVGAAEHREALKAFVCCAPHVNPPGPRRRDVCLEPWAHDVQKHIRVDALSRQRGPGRRLDNRLLLLWDGDELVAVGAHEQIAGEPPRIVEFLAVRTDMRGRSLSDGRRCSDAALAMVLDDITSRPPPTNFAQAIVRDENFLSANFLTRHGGLISPELIDGCRAVLLPC